MSGGRHASMESLVHQMAAQSVGHMDEGRPRTGGGQWFAHLVSATVALAALPRLPPGQLRYAIFSDACPRKKEVCIALLARF